MLSGVLKENGTVEEPEIEYTNRETQSAYKGIDAQTAYHRVQSNKTTKISWLRLSNTIDTRAAQSTRRTPHTAHHKRLCERAETRAPHAQRTPPQSHLTSENWDEEWNRKKRNESMLFGTTNHRTKGRTKWKAEQRTKRRTVTMTLHANSRCSNVCSVFAARCVYRAGVANLFVHLLLELFGSAAVWRVIYDLDAHAIRSAFCILWYAFAKNSKDHRHTVYYERRAHYSGSSCRHTHTHTHLSGRRLFFLSSAVVRV